MSDSDNTQDSAAMSPASAGSVANEPVAWAVLDSRGTVCVAYTCREAAEAYCEGTFNRLAPLYRQPQDGVVRLPQAPDDFEISEANGYAAAIVDFKRALAEAGIEWTE